MFLSATDSQIDPISQVYPAIEGTASIYEYCLSQPTTAPRNSSRTLSATKSSTHLFLVSLVCLVNVPLTILIRDDQHPYLV